MADLGSGMGLWVGERFNRRGFLGRVGQAATAFTLATRLALHFGERAFAAPCGGSYCCVDPFTTFSSCCCCAAGVSCPGDPSCYTSWQADMCCNHDSDCANFS